jgi:hypothetical protein
MRRPGPTHGQKRAGCQDRVVHGVLRRAGARQPRREQWCSSAVAVEELDHARKCRTVVFSAG